MTCWKEPVGSVVLGFFGLAVGCLPAWSELRVVREADQAWRPPAARVWLRATLGRHPSGSWVVEGFIKDRSDRKAKG